MLNAVEVVVQDMTPAELGIIAATRQPSRTPYGEAGIVDHVPLHLNNAASGRVILLSLAASALTDRIIDLVRRPEPITAT